jgi:rubrerythrin
VIRVKKKSSDSAKATEVTIHWQEQTKGITMNIFDCAIKMEEEARMYYEKLAADTAVPELKNLFTMLAESEQEHHDALVELKENKEHIMAGFKDLQGAACHFKPLLAKKNLKVEPLEVSDDI